MNLLPCAVNTNRFIWPKTFQGFNWNFIETFTSAKTHGRVQTESEWQRTCSRSFHGQKQPDQTKFQFTDFCILRTCGQKLSGDTDFMSAAHRADEWLLLLQCQRGALKRCPEEECAAHNSLLWVSSQIHHNSDWLNPLRRTRELKETSKTVIKELNVISETDYLLGFVLDPFGLKLDELIAVCFSGVRGHVFDSAGPGSVSPVWLSGSSF